MKSTTEWKWPDVILEHRSRLGLSYLAPDDVEAIETPQGFYLGRGGEMHRVERGVVYRARELRHLVGIQPSFEDLSALHEIKRLFGGEITASQPRPRRRWSEQEVAELWAGWPAARRERYVSKRQRALEWLGTSEETATPEERALAASWATEQALSAELGGEEVAP